MQFSTVLSAAALVGSTLAAYSNGTVTVTTDVIVTDYTTYCPYSTEVVIKTCHEEKCAPTTITVSEATTLTVTGECEVPTTYTTTTGFTTETVSCEECKPTVAPESSASSAAPAVTSYEGAAARNVAGALAGVAAVAAALI